MGRKPLTVLLISVGLILPLLLVINYLKGEQMDKITARRQERLKYHQTIRDNMIEIEKLLEAAETKLENQEDVAQELKLIITKKEIIDNIKLKEKGSLLEEFINKLNSLEELIKNGGPEPGVLLTKMQELRQFLEDNKTPQK